MWSFASKAINGTIGLNNDILKLNQAPSECSDDEPSFNNSKVLILIISLKYYWFLILLIKVSLISEKIKV